MSTQRRGKRLLVLPLLHTPRTCECFSGCSWHTRCNIHCVVVRMTLVMFMPSMKWHSVPKECVPRLWSRDRERFSKVWCWLRCHGRCLRFCGALSAFAAMLESCVNSLIHSIESSHEFLLTPRDMLLWKTYIYIYLLICLFSQLTLVRLLIGSGQLNDLHSECEIHKKWRWLLNQKTLAGVQQLSYQPSECDRTKPWRRFPCPWRSWDSWELNGQHFRQSSWIRRWRRF